MKALLIYIFTFFLTFSSFSQSKKAYEIFTAAGKKTKFSKVIKQAIEKEVLLFGELHNNPIAHWLEFELVKELSTKRKLILGAEMFETDQQEELNLYLKDSINQEALAQNIKLWSNYNTDYKPLVDFSKAKKIPFIATNVPQIYASLTYKEGFKPLETLVPEEQKYIAPQPIVFNAELPQYKKILTEIGEHGTPELVKAQAIKDATMAYFIQKNRKDDALFIHINGAYHSDFKEGIHWYLKQTNANLNTLTISTVEQDSIEQLNAENINKADFIICIPSSMTKTY